MSHTNSRPYSRELVFSAVHIVKKKLKEHKFVFCLLIHIIVTSNMSMATTPEAMICGVLLFLKLLSTKEALE